MKVSHTEMLKANRLKRKRALKTHRLQYAEYLSFLRSNPEMATNNDKVFLKTKYEELANILNKMDVGPSHTADAWRKIFVDWKFQTRNKARKIRSNSANDSAELLALSELEKQAMETWGDVSIAGSNSYNKSTVKHEVTDTVMYIVTDKEGNLLEEPQMQQEVVRVIPEDHEPVEIDSHKETTKTNIRNASRYYPLRRTHLRTRAAHSIRLQQQRLKKNTAYRTEKLEVEKKKVRALERLADSADKFRNIMTLFVSVCGEMSQRLDTDSDVDANIR